MLLSTMRGHRHAECAKPKAETAIGVAQEADVENEPMMVQCVAEIASAHDGVLERALGLVDVAAECGADVVKAQYFHSPDKMAERRHVPDHYRAIYHRYNVPEGWLPILRDRAHERGMLFACTAFLVDAVPIVARYADLIKIASFEALDETLLRAAQHTELPVMVSAGMCSEGELLSLWGRPNVKVLHCVSAYQPCPMEALNLAVIRVYNLDGFSDHTANVQTGALAVAAGARILETHIKLDDTDPENPDFAPALFPVEYWEYVKRARQAAVSLGDWQKKPQAVEADMSRYRVAS